MKYWIGLQNELRKWKLIIGLVSQEVSAIKFETEYRKPHLKWSLKARRGSSYTLTTPGQLQTPSWKEGYLALPTRSILYYSSKKEEFLLCSVNKKIPQPSQWETVTTLNFRFSSNRLCSKQPLPTSFSLSSNIPLLWSSDLPMVCHPLHVLNCNFSASPK